MANVNQHKDLIQGDSEPGIEFMKVRDPIPVVAVKDTTHLLPSIHSLPGASTLYNSYRSVIQGWKNSTPKLVQYQPSDLEVVVYRKNGQVDTLRAGSGVVSNDQRDNNQNEQGTLSSSIDAKPAEIQSQILSAGLKQLQIEVNSTPVHSSDTGNGNNLLFHVNQEADSTKPLSSSNPQMSKEFRYYYEHGVYEPTNNDSNGLLTNSGAQQQSKLIPDLEGIVSNLMKNPEPPTVQEVVENNMRQEYELCSGKDAKDLLQTLKAPRKVPLLNVGNGPKANMTRGKNCSFLIAGSRIPIDDYVKAAQSISANAHKCPVVLPRSESYTTTIMQTEIQETVMASTQTAVTVEDDPKEKEPVKPVVEQAEFSCQAEPEPVIFADISIQCQPNYVDFCCQEELPIRTRNDAGSQCNFADFGYQLVIPAIVEDHEIQCELEVTEVACQSEVVPIECANISVQCNPETNTISMQSVALCCQQRALEVNQMEEDLEKAKEEIILIAEENERMHAILTVEREDFECQFGCATKALTDSSIQCKPVTKSSSTPSLCCQHSAVIDKRKYMEQLRTQNNLERMRQQEKMEAARKLGNNPERLKTIDNILHERTKINIEEKMEAPPSVDEEKVLSAVDRFNKVRGDENVLYGKLENEIQDIKEWAITQQELSKSSIHNESVEYFEDEWLPLSSDGNLGDESVTEEAGSLAFPQS